MRDFLKAYSGPITITFKNDEFEKLKNSIMRIEAAAARIAAEKDIPVNDEDYPVSAAAIQDFNRDVFIGRIENAAKTLEAIADTID